jgi:hypothetical protein
MSGFEIIGVIDIVAHVAHKLWTFGAKVVRARKVAGRIAENLYYISSIVVQADTVLDQSNPALQKAVKSLRGLAAEAQYINNQANEHRWKWAYHESKLQELLRRLEIQRAVFSTMLQIRDSSRLARRVP